MAGRAFAGALERSRWRLEFPNATDSIGTFSSETDSIEIRAKWRFCRAGEATGHRTLFPVVALKVPSLSEGEQTRLNVCATYQEGDLVDLYFAAFYDHRGAICLAELNDSIQLATIKDMATAFMPKAEVEQHRALLRSV